MNAQSIVCYGDVPQRRCIRPSWHPGVAPVCRFSKAPWLSCACLLLCALLHSRPAQAQAFFEQDVPFSFSTRDQSAWGPGRGGYSFDYTVGTPGDESTTFGGSSYVHLVIPGIPYITPDIDLGTWGGAAKGYVHANAGLRFHAGVSSGTVDASVPLTLVFKYSTVPDANNRYLYVGYLLDDSAQITTTSPDAEASLSAYLQAGMTLGIGLSTGVPLLDVNNDIFDGLLANIGLDNLPAGGNLGDVFGGTISGNTPLLTRIVHNDQTGHNELSLFDISAVDLANKAIGGQLSYEKQDEEYNPLITGSLHIPKVTTSGFPGTGSGGAGKIASSGHDWVVKLDCDVTNLLTWAARKAGIPLPDFNFDKTFGNDNFSVSCDLNMLDLRATGQLGFEQDFLLTPQPTLVLNYVYNDSNGKLLEIGQLPAVVVKPGDGSDLTLLTPINLPPQPAGTASVTLTPLLTFDNAFSSKLLLWGYTGLDFDVIKEDITASIDNHDVLGITLQPFPTQTKGISGTVDLGIPDFYGAGSDPVANPGQPLEGFVDSNQQSQSQGAPFTIFFGGSGNGNYTISLSPSSCNEYGKGSGDGGGDTSNDPQDVLVTLTTQGGQWNWDNSTKGLQTTFYWDYGTPNQQTMTTLNPNGYMTPGNLIIAQILSPTQVRFPILASLLTPPGNHTVTAVISTGTGTQTTTATFTVLNPVPYSNGLYYPDETVGDGSDSLAAIPATGMSELDGVGGLQLKITGGNFNASTGILWETLDTNGQSTARTILKVDSLNLEPDNTYALFTIPPALLSQVGTVNVSVKNGRPGGGTGSPQPLRIYAVQPTVTAVTRQPAKIGLNKTGDKKGYYVTDSNIYARTGDVLVDVVGTNFVAQTALYLVNGTQDHNDGSVASGDTADTPLTTIYVDPTHVRAILPETELDARRSFVLYARNPYIYVGENGIDNSGGNSSAFTVPTWNPTPLLGNISPDNIPPDAMGVKPRDTVVVGSPDTILYIDGSKFAPGATVTISNGSLSQSLPASFVSQTQLQITVPAAFFALQQGANGLSPLPLTATAVNAGQVAGAPASNAVALTVAYPVPQVGSLPSRVFVDTNSKVMVPGNGYFPTSVAFCNGVPCPSNVYVNATTLTVQPPADVIGPAHLTVKNPTPGGGISNQALLNILRDVTNTVSLSTAAPISIGNGNVTQTVTITANKTLNGPVSLLLANLVGGKLSGGNGVSTIAPPLGSPYVTLGGAVKQGQKFILHLRFSAASPSALKYTPYIIAGGAP